MGTWLMTHDKNRGWIPFSHLINVQFEACHHRWQFRWSGDLLRCSGSCRGYIWRYPKQCGRDEPTMLWRYHGIYQQQNYIWVCLKVVDFGFFLQTKYGLWGTKFWQRVYQRTKLLLREQPFEKYQKVLYFLQSLFKNNVLGNHMRTPSKGSGSIRMVFWIGLVFLKVCFNVV